MPSITSSGLMATLFSALASAQINFPSAGTTVVVQQTIQIQFETAALVEPLDLLLVPRGINDLSVIAEQIGLQVPNLGILDWTPSLQIASFEQFQLVIVDSLDARVFSDPFDISGLNVEPVELSVTRENVFDQDGTPTTDFAIEVITGPPGDIMLFMSGTETVNQLITPPVNAFVGGNDAPAPTPAPLAPLNPLPGQQAGGADAGPVSLIPLGQAPAPDAGAGGLIPLPPPNTTPFDLDEFLATRSVSSLEGVETTITSVPAAVLTDLPDVQAPPEVAAPPPVVAPPVVAAPPPVLAPVNTTLALGNTVTAITTAPIGVFTPIPVATQTAVVDVPAIVDPVVAAPDVVASPLPGFQTIPADGGAPVAAPAPIATVPSFVNTTQPTAVAGGAPVAIAPPVGGFQTIVPGAAAAPPAVAPPLATGNLGVPAVVSDGILPVETILPDSTVAPAPAVGGVDGGLQPLQPLPGVGDAPVAAPVDGGLQALPGLGDAPAPVDGGLQALPGLGDAPVDGGVADPVADVAQPTGGLGLLPGQANATATGLQGLPGATGTGFATVVNGATGTANLIGATGTPEEQEQAELEELAELGLDPNAATGAAPGLAVAKASFAGVAAVMAYLTM